MLLARVEIVLAAVFAALAALTAAAPTWIERVFRIDPDFGSGSVEWGIVAGFGILAVAVSMSARRHFRRARTRMSA
jgi:hypothetical protein